MKLKLQKQRFYGLNILLISLIVLSTFFHVKSYPDADASFGAISEFDSDRLRLFEIDLDAIGTEIGEDFSGYMAGEGVPSCELLCCSTVDNQFYIMIPNWSGLPSSGRESVLLVFDMEGTFLKGKHYTTWRGNQIVKDDDDRIFVSEYVGVGGTETNPVFSEIDATTLAKTARLTVPETIIGLPSGIVNVGGYIYLCGRPKASDIPRLIKIKKSDWTYVEIDVTSFGSYGLFGGIYVEETGYIYFGGHGGTKGRLKVSDDSVSAWNIGSFTFSVMPMVQDTVNQYIIVGEGGSGTGSTQRLLLYNYTADTYSDKSPPTGYGPSGKFSAYWHQELDEAILILGNEGTYFNPPDGQFAWNYTHWTDLSGKFDSAVGGTFCNGAGSLTEDKILDDGKTLYFPHYQGIPNASYPMKLVWCAYVYDSDFDFHGLYNETTGLFTLTGVNVTAYFTDGTTPKTFEVNGTYPVAFSTKPEYFHFELGTNDREYWLGDTETTAVIYIFNASTTVYTISFLDLAGILHEYSFVTAKRYINGTSHIVEKRKLDIEKKVVMSLVNGVKYDITVSNGASYTFGDLLMTSVTTITLTLKGLEFPERIMLGYKYVRSYATRNMTGGTPITIFYEDTLNQTNNVNIKVYFQSNDSVAWSDTHYTASFVADWFGSDNITDYWCEVTINHAKFGIMSLTQVLPRIFSANPWSLAFLGTLPFDTALLIPSFLVLCVFGVFSRLNIMVGLFAGVSVATILAYIGWFLVGSEVLIFCWGFVIIVALAYSRRSVYVT